MSSQREILLLWALSSRSFRTADRIIKLDGSALTSLNQDGFTILEELLMNFHLAHEPAKYIINKYPEVCFNSKAIKNKLLVANIFSRVYAISSIARNFSSFLIDNGADPLTTVKDSLGKDISLLEQIIVSRKINSYAVEPLLPFMDTATLKGKLYMYEKIHRKFITAGDLSRKIKEELKRREDK